MTANGAERKLILDIPNFWFRPLSGRRGLSSKPMNSRQNLCDVIALDRAAL